ncbi:MAG: hypothetical protein WD046_02660 [Paracoccaceae bacterium]
MSSTKQVICLALFFVVPIQASAEACVMVVDSDGVQTPTLVYNGGLYTLEPAFEDYNYMLFDACNAWGATIETGCDIYPMMGAIKWNAVATICDGNKVIVYDRRISANIGYEGAQAVIAHELGHHFCNHLSVSSLDTDESHKRELEADRFAGATLRRIGFGRDATLNILPLLGEQPSLSHPARTEREVALLAGWDDPTTGLACLSR